jgi:CO dehydrogenase/acetyl-CoA synthase alpha subunit
MIYQLMLNVGSNNKNVECVRYLPISVQTQAEAHEYISDDEINIVAEAFKGQIKDMIARAVGRPIQER